MRLLRRLQLTRKQCRRKLTWRKQVNCINRCNNNKPLGSVSDVEPVRNSVTIQKCPRIKTSHVVLKLFELEKCKTCSDIEVDYKRASFIWQYFFDNFSLFLLLTLIKFFVISYPWQALLHLSVSTRGVIGQFCGRYFTVRHAKFESLMQYFPFQRALMNLRDIINILLTSFSRPVLKYFKAAAHERKELSKLPLEVISSAVSSSVRLSFCENFATRCREENI